MQSKERIYSTLLALGIAPIAGFVFLAFMAIASGEMDYFGLSAYVMFFAFIAVAFFITPILPYINKLIASNYGLFFPLIAAIYGLFSFIIILSVYFQSLDFFSFNILENSGIALLKRIALGIGLLWGVLYSLVYNRKFLKK